MIDFIKWCNTNSGFIMALLTLAYVSTTIFIYFANKKSVDLGKKQLEELINEREARERPYVVMSFEVIRGGLLCLKIENLGLTPAINLIIKLESEFKDNVIKISGHDSINYLENCKMYLAPRQKHYIFLASQVQVDQLAQTPICGQIKYNEKFKEDICIDMKNYGWKLLYDSPIEEISIHLKEIKESSKKMADCIKKMDK